MCDLLLMSCGEEVTLEESFMNSSSELFLMRTAFFPKMLSSTQLNL